jgi:hypothetical protein
MLATMAALQATGSKPEAALSMDKHYLTPLFSPESIVVF